MTRKTLSALAAVASLIVWGLLFTWRTQMPPPFNPQVELVSVQSNESVHINLPQLLPKGDYVLEVYSTVRARDWIDGQTGQALAAPLANPLGGFGVTEFVTPRIVYRKGFTEWTQVSIPPVLTKGAYTVVMHINYGINPIKRIEQSALIAVVVVR